MANAWGDAWGGDTGAWLTAWGSSGGGGGGNEEIRFRGALNRRRFGWGLCIALLIFL